MDNNDIFHYVSLLYLQKMPIKQDSSDEFSDFADDFSGNIDDLSDLESTEDATTTTPSAAEIAEETDKSSEGTKGRKRKEKGDSQEPRVPKKRGPKKKAMTEERREKLKLRRVKANSRERNRMHGLNEALDVLRKYVPCYSKTQKLSKIETLRLARNYIQALADILKTGIKPDTLTFAKALSKGMSQNTMNMVAGCLQLNPRTLTPENQMTKGYQYQMYRQGFGYPGLYPSNMYSSDMFGQSGSNNNFLMSAQHNTNMQNQVYNPMLQNCSVSSPSSVMSTQSTVTSPAFPGMMGLSRDLPNNTSPLHAENQEAALPQGTMTSSKFNYYTQQPHPDSMQQQQQQSSCLQQQRMNIPYIAQQSHHHGQGLNDSVLIPDSNPDGILDNLSDFNSSASDDVSMMQHASLPPHNMFDSNVWQIKNN